MLPLFSGAPRIWQSGAKPGIWGRSPQPPTDFHGFHIKNTHLGTLFIEKGRILPAVRAVFNRQHKNNLVGLYINLKALLCLKAKATERAKIVTLNEEGWAYSERQISKTLKFSKTAFHQAISKFWEFSGLAQVWKT